MKKIILVLVMVIAVFLQGCGDEEAEENVLLDKYYCGSWKQDSMGFSQTIVAKFHEDGVVEWVDCNLWDEIYKKYYGVYEIDGRKMTIELSGEDKMTCIIHDSGDSITIDGEQFRVADKLKQETIAQFD